jgi:hypothetical protein
MRPLTVTQTLEIEALAKAYARKEFGAQVTVTITPRRSEHLLWRIHIPNLSAYLARCVLAICIGLTAAAVAAEVSYFAGQPQLLADSAR